MLNLELIRAYLLPYLLPPDLPLLFVLLPHQVIHRTIHELRVESLHPTSVHPPVDGETPLELIVDEEVVIVGIPPAYLGLVDDLGLSHLDEESLADALHEVLDVLNEEAKEELGIHIVLEILEALLDGY